VPNALAAIIATTLFLVLPVLGETAAALRVCADPDNLPFSSAGSGDRGLYVDLARMIAARLGIDVEYVWGSSEWGARAIRNTLLSDRCDALVGLPYEKGFMGGKVALTRPFLSVGYVIVAPMGSGFQRLEDLQGKTIGVQFGSPAQLVLAARGGFQAVTFRFAEEIMDALARREVQTAFVWGPIAGYYNKTRLASEFEITPVAGPGLQWQVAIGVKKGDDVLKTRLERALEELSAEIAVLMDQYGFPRSEPVPLGARGNALRLAAADESSMLVWTRAKPVGDDRAVAEEGRSLFNIHCSHCHAPNAVNPDARTDLRRLRLRYGEDMTRVFYTTVTEGRPSNGMPSWKATLSEETIGKILTFLESVQKEP
jgi:polar amino acid transport system substrate-binding protein